MIRHVNDSPYYVDDSGFSGVQSSAEYQDVSELHAYLNSTKQEGEYVPKFEVMNSLMDCFSDLRALAEDKAERENWVKVDNQRDALPLDIDDVCDYLHQIDNDQEPPLRMIVKIAQENYDTISVLVKNLHKVLRRERSMVRVDKVQQLDSRCMSWLSRQPGRTPAERAGSRQEILSVVRYESVDTLENRVLKECMRLCKINADTYIHDFGNYKDSKRIEAVTNLKQLCMMAFETEEFKSISRLKMMPAPNYVLLNNVNYNTIWNIYRQLLNKTRLLESIWKYRQVVFKDMVKLMVFAICHEKMDLKESPIRYQVWVSRFLDDDTQNYLKDTKWIYMNMDPVLGNQYCVSNRFARIICDACRRGQHSVKRIQFAYIPDKVKLAKFENMCNLIVFKESCETRISNSGFKKIIELGPDRDIISNLYACIAKILEGWEEAR